MLVEAVQIKKFRENIIIPDNATNIVSPSSVDVSIKYLICVQKLYWNFEWMRISP